MVEQLTNDPELEGLNPAIAGIWELKKNFTSKILTNPFLTNKL